MQFVPRPIGRLVGLFNSCMYPRLLAGVPARPGRFETSGSIVMINRIAHEHVHVHVFIQGLGKLSSSDASRMRMLNVL